MFLFIYQASESGLVDLSQKKDSVIANEQILKSFLQSPEQARELQLRLDNISFLWQQLQEKIQKRICELKFEWTQFVSQNIHTYMYNVCEVNWSGDFCITIRTGKKVQGSNLHFFSTHSKLNFCFQNFAATPTLMFMHACLCCQKRVVNNVGVFD